MLFFWILIGSLLLFLLQRVLYTKYWDRGLRIEFRFTENAVNEGEIAGVLERSENRKRLPLPSFEYRYVVKRNYTVSQEVWDTAMTVRRKMALPIRRAVTNRARIEGLTRGVYSIDEITLAASDLFRTRRMESSVSCRSGMTVYPAKIPAEKLSLTVRLLMGSVLTRRMAQEDPFALKGIRPYEIYDSPKLINWKASARTGELKVNQFEYTTDEALLFLLDMGCGEEEDREEMLRLASSLSLLFLRRGVSVSLLANGRNCVNGLPLRVLPGAGVGHQITVDEALAHVNLAHPATEPFGSFLSGISRESLRGALPVAISADPSGESLQAFEAAPGTKGGYFLSVHGKGRDQAGSGITVINWDGAEGEAVL